MKSMSHIRMHSVSFWTGMSLSFALQEALQYLQNFPQSDDCKSAAHQDERSKEFSITGI